MACQLKHIGALTEDNSLSTSLLQSRILVVWTAKKYIVFARNRLLRLLGGREKRNGASQPAEGGAMAGRLPAGNGVSRFREGEMVRIRAKEEIRSGLDDWGASGGCIFTPEMFQYCGETHRVLKNVEYFYDEIKQRMCKCREIVILEGITCSGRRKMFPAVCDRCCHYFWHSSWLEKVPAGSMPLDEGRADMLQ